MTLARTAANVRPINPDACEVVNGVLGGTITAGEWVYHNGTNWVQGALSSGANAGSYAICLVGGVSGDTRPLLLRGRLTGWSDFADGTTVYTAASGEVNDQAHPQYAVPIGFSISDTDWILTGPQDAPHAS